MSTVSPKRSVVHSNFTDSDTIEDGVHYIQCKHCDTEYKSKKSGTVMLNDQDFSSICSDFDRKKGISI